MKNKVQKGMFGYITYKKKKMEKVMHNIQSNMFKYGKNVLCYLNV